MSSNAPHGTPGDPESREETLARVAAVPPRPDPSTRRRLGKKAVLLGHITALVVGIVVASITLFSDGSVPLALALGAGVALGIGVVSTLLLAEDEDGRVDQATDAGTRDAPR